MEEDNCTLIKDAIDPILKNAETSYNVIYHGFENFTLTTLNRTHKDFHETFRSTNYDWLHPNGQPLEFDDYDSDKDLPEDVIKHLSNHANRNFPPNYNELKEELTKIRTRFHYLTEVLKIIKDHDNEVARAFLADQHTYAGKVLNDTISGMKMLKIEVPELNVDISVPESNIVRELRDFIVTRENLKLLRYVMAYNLLLNRCSR